MVLQRELVVAQSLTTFSLLFFFLGLFAFLFKGLLIFSHYFLAVKFKTSLLASKFQLETERYTEEARYKNAQQLRYNHSDESSVTIVTFHKFV